MLRPAKSRTLFALCNSPQQRQWKHDRALRQRLPWSEAWRGCLGLAALPDPGAAAVRVGSRQLVPSDCLSWLCLRDIPAGHCPGSPSLDRREVNYVTSTRATLRFGTPCLQFQAAGREAWDFRMLPLGRQLRRWGSGSSELLEAHGDLLCADRYPRAFGVLNALSQAMTRFAFCAIDENGCPYRRPWWACRPPAWSPQVPQPLASRMPQPYLAFPESLAEPLYRLATTTRDQKGHWACPRCRCSIPQDHMTRPARRMFEDGTIAAVCPGCGQDATWCLSDALARGAGRQFAGPFRRGFTDAVALGLPLVAPEPLRYLGLATSGRGKGPPLQGHRFERVLHGQEHRLYLPPDARLYVLPAGTEGSDGLIPAGSVFGRALSSLPSPQWLARMANGRWTHLAEPCGRIERVGLLQQLWFCQQVLRVAEAPGQILVPAALVGAACCDLRPTGLWWDLAPAAQAYDAALDAYVLPPLPLRRWEGLRVRLPGEIDLDAGIADPRFDLSSPRRIPPARVAAPRLPPPRLPGRVPPASWRRNSSTDRVSLQRAPLAVGQ